MGFLRRVGGIVVIIWLLGFALKIGGNFIHILLLVAAVVFIFDVISGKRIYKHVERKYSKQNGSNTQDSNGNQSSNPLDIGGKTVYAWEMEWKSIGVLRDLNLTHYNKYVGVYREWLNEKIIYIGKAIEWSNGGFKEKLSDYAEDGDIARTHKFQQKMHEYSNQIHIDIIITGSHAESVKVAAQLEASLIAKYRPEWNVMI